MLIESESYACCILRITNHPQALINSGSEGFFCFREHTSDDGVGLFFKGKIFFGRVKIVGGFFEYS
jgi:hypothetical protein